jgi:hypothetical protein
MTDKRCIPDPTDLVDQQIGRLTVKMLGRKIGGVWHYQCQCVCGNLITVARHQLMGATPNVRSCGCWGAETRHAWERQAQARTACTRDFYRRHATRHPHA